MRLQPACEHREFLPSFQAAEAAHVLPDTPRSQPDGCGHPAQYKMRFIELRPARTDTVGYLLAFALCAVSLLAFGLLEREPHTHFLFPTLYASIIAAGWYGGFAAAATATVFSGGASAYWFLRPTYSFAVSDPDARVALALFVASGLILGFLADLLHRRYEHECVARVNAENEARRTEHLQQIATALSKARTLEEVLETCVIECTYTFSAAAGAMVLVDDDGAVEISHAVGLPAASLGHLRMFSLRGVKTPIADAIESRAIVALESHAVRVAKYGDSADAVFPKDHQAVVAVPVSIRGRAAAAFALGTPVARVWTHAECDFLQDVAVRVAHALDRAQAYQLAERARVDAESLRARADLDLAERQKVEAALRDSEARYRALAARTSRLHALTAALSEALTVDAVAKAVVRQGKLVVGAQAGSVTLLIANGTQFETLADDSLSDNRRSGRFSAAAGLCQTTAVDTRQPVFVGSFADLQRDYWRSAAQAADGGFESAVALPLLAEGAPLGVLSFHFTAPVNFDDEYRTLLTSVAQHCAQALDRARLYETEHGARADAEAENRLKDDFLSTVSHELRTPLNAILGWAAMLRTGSLDSGRTVRAIQAINDNATRQARLVDELLDVSRIAAGRASLDLQKIDLGEMLRGAVESVLPAAEAQGVTVSLHAPASLHLDGDIRRLEQVFLNLLSNAVKFTPPGGRIDLRAAVSDRHVEVQVADTGIGIDPDFLPHVFDRFRQADSNTTRTHGGLGLGLSIARNLVDAHGGAIRVDSAGRGCGTTFTVTLPLALASTQSGTLQHADRSLAPNAMPDLTGVRVLVVDDEPDAREMMACALANCGTTVLTAGSSQEALDALTHTDVDVLLADIGMPVEDGYALIRKVRTLPSARSATVPAAAVTAYAREDQRQQALAAGFQLHLAKPVDPPQLARAVAALLRQNALT
jgi:K+-sensing histidine kinase KdpD/ActR/RegA family two-component response regulator